MIAADTSSFIAYLNGENADDTDLIDQALLDETLVLPPIVIAELLSAKNVSESAHAIITTHELMPIKDGFWIRAGENRATILRAKKKANLADSMIATFCLDHDLPLISRDRDYRHFTEYFQLVVHSNSK